MKKVKMATIDVAKAYAVIREGKLTNLDAEDKIKVWKTALALKPIADKYNDDSEDAREKMKPENYDDDLMKAQEFERMSRTPNADMTALQMGPAEYNEFINRNVTYQRIVNDAMKDFAKKEVEIDVEQVSLDTLMSLQKQNGWTVEQMMAVAFIVEDKKEGD